MDVKFMKLREAAKIPCYSHEGDAGMDLFSCEQRTLEQGEPYMFKIGIASEFPASHVALVHDRSSMGLRGVRTLGGVIDAHYRGEWGIVLINLTDREVTIRPGDKIAQVLFMPVEQANAIEATSLSETKRGDGGFGSTGR